MKKYLFVLASMIAVMCANAQDVTLTFINGQQMKGTLLSQCDTSLSIHVNGQFPRDLTIPADKLLRATVFCQSGKVNLVSENGKILVKNGHNVPTEQSSLSFSKEKEGVSSMADGGWLPPQTSYVNRINNTYFVNGRQYNKAGFQEYLRLNTPSAYYHFRDGYQLARRGGAVLGVGAGLELIGGVLLACQRTTSNPGITAAFGSLFSSVGGACISVGIICVSVGYGKMHNSADIYNIQMENRNVVQFNLIASGNGLGLAINL